MWKFIFIFLSLFIRGTFSETCPPQEDITPCFCSTAGGRITIRCYHLKSLEQLKNSLKGLNGRKISYFEIKNSEIEYIPHDLFENVTVREIDVSVSNFSRIGMLGEPQFKGLENSLEILKFTKSFTRSNPFSYVSMQHLKRLTTLEVRDCFVEIVQNVFFREGPKSLRTIRFARGNIRVLGHTAFSALTNLEVIDLSENDLTFIPRWAFPEPASHLQELNLERNKFQTLPEDIFTDMPNLKTVNLELNEFSTIDETLWRPIWNNLESLNIDYNPLICDKKIKWIYNSDKDLERKLTATCFKPFHLMDRELHSLNPKELS